MKKISIAVIVMSILISPLFAEAKGRTGSFRIGGYTSHGKGSHYIGGFLYNKL